MANPNPSSAPPAPLGNRYAAKADPKRVRNRQAKISQADTEHFAALGLPRVTAALEALHTGEAIYMLISPEYASEIDEVIANLEAVINQHRYEWHPSHTENTMRGLVAALTACREYANAVQAFGQYPTRGGKRPNSGAPIGNSNGRKEITRDIPVMMRLSQDEHDTIAAATDGKKLSTWLRETVLAAANKENLK